MTIGTGARLSADGWPDVAGMPGRSVLRRAAEDAMRAEKRGGVIGGLVLNRAGTGRWVQMSNAAVEDKLFAFDPWALEDLLGRAMGHGWNVQAVFHSERLLSVGRGGIRLVTPDGRWRGLCNTEIRFGRVAGDRGRPVAIGVGNSGRELWRVRWPWK